MKIINHTPESYREALLQAIQDRDIFMMKTLREGKGKRIVIIEEFYDAVKLINGIGSDNDQLIFTENARLAFEALYASESTLSNG